jgi:hypothetical protein
MVGFPEYMLPSLHQGIVIIARKSANAVKIDPYTSCGPLHYTATTQTYDYSTCIYSHGGQIFVILLCPPCFGRTANIDGLSDHTAGIN